MINRMNRSLVLEHLNLFRVANIGTKLMREHVDMFLLWSVIDYFKPKSLLEIGFAAGQTMGLIYEASGKSGSYLSVDIDYSHRTPFDAVFPDANIEYLNIDSRKVKFDRKFDFIHIDGDHSYEMVSNDIDKCLPCMNEKTILYLDDYYMESVQTCIKDSLLDRNDFVPFLAGDQGIFFHHRSQSKDQFLDVDIQNKSKNFIYFKNESIFDNVVLRARIPNIFVENPKMFIDALKFYDL